MADLNSIRRFLEEYDGDDLYFMEVCGTHTAAISENGIHKMVSPKIHLISGPGCPVCVTVASYIDRLVELSLEENTCVVTFGDMIRVRGTRISLSDAKALGAHIQMVYSPVEIIELARKNPSVKYVFAAVGFETTTPIYALIMDTLVNERIKNVRFLTALKTMPAVIDKVASMRTSLSGFLAPGHVSVITGSNIFEPLARKYSLPFVVSGFEGEQLLASIYALVKKHDQPIVLNLYKNAVTAEGNKEAMEKVSRYFDVSEAAWRGLGIIDNSGLVLKEEYMEYDAGSKDLIQDNMYNKGCSCASVITGMAAPVDCPLYGKVCTPDNPQGACMVSTEGSCFNYYVNRRE